MRAYTVTATDDDVQVAVRYAGTNADAKAKKDELVEKFDLKKNQVVIEQVEIPVDKNGLLEFINELSEKSDMEEGGE